jgi:hypothetical protein
VRYEDLSALLIQTAAITLDDDQAMKSGRTERTRMKTLLQEVLPYRENGFAGFMEALDLFYPQMAATLRQVNVDQKMLQRYGLSFPEEW